MRPRVAVLIALMSTAPVAVQQTHHPLDPLTASETTRAALVLRQSGCVTAQTRFATIPVQPQPGRTRPDEQYAAGEADRAIVDTDVVLWFTLGVTHIPRPEDWPYMSVHRGGFRLVPTSFCARNPTLDVPETR